MVVNYIFYKIYIQYRPLYPRSMSLMINAYLIRSSEYIDVVLTPSCNIICNYISFIVLICFPFFCMFWYTNNLNLNRIGRVEIYKNLLNLAIFTWAKIRASSIVVVCHIIGLFRCLVISVFMEWIFWLRAKFFLCCYDNVSYLLFKEETHSNVAKNFETRQHPTQMIPNGHSNS